MIKGIVVVAALAGSLVVAPAALAAPIDPAGAVPGYGLEHAGHDHGPAPERPKPRPDKRHDEKSDKKKGHGDSAHAEGGYDSHRSHPRNW